MPIWSSLCAGRVPPAWNAASSGRFASPFWPGGSTLRKPPASSCPYGSGAGGVAPVGGPTGGSGGSGTPCAEAPAGSSARTTSAATGRA